MTVQALAAVSSDIWSSESGSVVLITSDPLWLLSYDRSPMIALL